MPVMVLYKDKSIATAVSEGIAEAVAAVTDKELKAKVEVRVIEPVTSFNSNEIHLEMRYREFMEWSEQQLASYHKAVMAAIGEVLKSENIKCAYSFYILPSTPPRSIWAQDKVD